MNVYAITSLSGGVIQYRYGAWLSREKADKFLESLPEYDRKYFGVTYLRLNDSTEYTQGT